MKLIDRSNIDIALWQKRIGESEIENIFCNAWYLDAVSDNWSAVVTEDYKTIVPIPFTSKLGVKQFYNAPFCREYEIFGSEFDWKDLAEFLKGDFKAMRFRNETPELFENGAARVHQLLTLSNETSASYKQNAKRLVKKSQKLFEIKSADNPSVLIDLFKETTAHKIDSIQEADLLKLETLMRSALDQNHGELFFSYSQEKIVAAAFFLKDKKRITYLKGASYDGPKKDGVMYGLMDFAIQRYQEEFSTFDFGGSDVEGVATFFKKFGAQDRTYFDYEIEHLPVWFKTLKKLKP